MNEYLIAAIVLIVAMIALYYSFQPLDGEETPQTRHVTRIYRK